MCVCAFLCNHVFAPFPCRQVLFVDAHSQLFTRQSNHCEFTLSAFESAAGELESPRHTLPPRTVCRYNFQGRRHEIVWISFVKYHSAVDQSVFEAPAECAPQLRIWDGKLRTHSKMGESGQFCGLGGVGGVWEWGRRSSLFTTSWSMCTCVCVCV